MTDARLMRKEPHPVEIRQMQGCHNERIQIVSVFFQLSYSECFDLGDLYSLDSLGDKLF